MKQITSDWLTDPRVQKVCTALSGAGHLVYFVGGCVRNELLGAPISDIDMATDAVPETVMNVAKAAGLKALPTGIDHGTITVISQGLSCEITTFRNDVETDGRRAVVQFSGSIKEDAKRRDFTMNALYADPKGNIIDPLNGLPDLLAGHVRFIENPTKRIQEDYLRILRFFRFHAWYGKAEDGIDPDGLAAISANLAGLDTLSGERVGHEILKALAAPNPSQAFATMQQTGVLGCILPGATAEYLPVLVHLEAECDAAPSALRRLASLGFGLDTKSRLRLSRKDALRLKALADETGKTTGAAELAYRYGFQFGLDVVLLRCAIFTTPLPKGLMDDLGQGGQAQFPVQALDLMPAYNGPALGVKLKELEACWIASGFGLGREELLK